MARAPKVVVITDQDIQTAILSVKGNLVQVASSLNMPLSELRKRVLNTQILQESLKTVKLEIATDATNVLIKAAMKAHDDPRFFPALKYLLEYVSDEISFNSQSKLSSNGDLDIAQTKADAVSSLKAKLMAKLAPPEEEE